MRIFVVFFSLLLVGCAGAEIDTRENFWRAFLQEKAPIGMPAEQVLAAMQQAGLNPSYGTYRTVRDDGTESANCPQPQAALMGFDKASTRGLYLSWDTEVTVCLDQQGRVLKHYVGTWNAGL